MNFSSEEHPRDLARRTLDDGNRLQAEGRLAEAQACYERARDLDPSFPRAHVNVGNALLERGDVIGALNAYAAALALDPTYAAAHFNSGNACWRARRLSDAAAHYRSALALNSQFVDALVGLGNVHDATGEFAQAEARYREALALRPDYGPVHRNLANVLLKQGDAGAALVAYRRASELLPQDAHARSFYYFCCLNRCDWSDRRATEETLVRMIHDGAGGLNPYHALFLESLDRGAGQVQLAAARNYVLASLGEALAAPPMRPAPRPHHQRLRIGYLSADFRAHAVMFLFKGVLAAHDTSSLSISLYARSAPRDEMTELARRSCERFRDLNGVSDKEAAKLIADDGIDILVEMSGFTSNVQLEIDALRPAPVIVSWLGYPGTLGHPRLADYIIGDRVVTPMEDAADFSECLALLPNCYQPNSRTGPLGDPPTRAQSGLPESGAVLCSLNACFKFGPAMFDCWCRILDSLPGSVLWLLEPGPVAKENLQREARARGIDSERLVFAPHVLIDQHLARLQLADLALDTFPYNSHTTASDALWAGVPLVTLKGRTFASRVAASILTVAGLPELVTVDLRGYEELALALLRDPQRLAGLRRKIIDKRLESPMFDTARFTRDLERLYARIWEQELRGVRAPVVLD